MSQKNNNSITSNQDDQQSSLVVPTPTSFNNNNYSLTVEYALMVQPLSRIEKVETNNTAVATTTPPSANAINTASMSVGEYLEVMKDDECKN